MQYLKRIIFKSDWGLKLSIINLIVLIPAFINGYILSRSQFNNLPVYNYRELNNLDLKMLEEKTQAEYGNFKIDHESRLIFLK